MDDQDVMEDRECPECHGVGYDNNDQPCEYCWGEGVLDIATRA